MRYLGNKTKLLDFVDNVFDKYHIEGQDFVDLFSGSCSVGDHYKNRFTVIANDYMYFAKVIASAKLLNEAEPGFEKFVMTYECTPFEYLNSMTYAPRETSFVYKNYSPIGGRMYFSEDNACRIDGARLDIERFYKDSIITESEYFFLLASLLESVLRVSNTSGTYQAFFKFWETRATKPLIISPLELSNCDHVSSDNKAYCEDANVLARSISGDIVYLDPPYTITQYANSYHVLETIARYDNPVLFGKTGRRKSRVLSNYSNKSKAIIEFEDLFRQLDFRHVLVSYSNQSIVPLDELVELASKFALNHVVHVETFKYREYSTNNSSYKNDGDGLKEAIIYFEKDRAVNKSPLNYSGSKDELVPLLNKLLPKHVTTFVDAMGGAFNVGANITAIDKVVFNEYNPFVFGIMKMIIESPKADLVNEVDSIVEKYQLKKKDKEAYLALRDHFNNVDNSPINLYTLQIYAFQNMIRFNSSLKMNTPVGNNEFNDGTRQRLKDYRIKTDKYTLENGSYNELPLSMYPEDTVFYFDPPYFITSAEYNDGKRGFEGWNVEKETELLDYLLQLHREGRHFILSNVIIHKGKKHNLLIKWVEEHGFNMVTLGTTGIKYPRVEVAITNYDLIPIKYLDDLDGD